MTNFLIFEYEDRKHRVKLHNIGKEGFHLLIEHNVGYVTPEWIIGVDITEKKKSKLMPYINEYKKLKKGQEKIVKEDIRRALSRRKELENREDLYQF